MRRKRQRDAGEPSHREGGEGGEFHLLRAGQATAGQALRTGAVVVGAADAIRVIVGVIDTDDERPRHHEGEKRAAEVRAVGSRCGTSTSDDWGEGISPRVRACALEPVFGSCGIGRK